MTPYRQQKAGMLDRKPHSVPVAPYSSSYPAPDLLGMVIYILCRFMLEFARLFYRGLELIDGLVSQKGLQALKQCRDYGDFCTMM